MAPALFRVRDLLIGVSLISIYVYQGLNVLYEKIAENGTVTKCVFGAGKLVARIKGGATTYYSEG